MQGYQLLTLDHAARMTCSAPLAPPLRLLCVDARRVGSSIVWGPCHAGCAVLYGSGGVLAFAAWSGRRLAGATASQT